MRVAKLYFEGQFEEAFIYRKRLLIFDTSKNLRVYNLRHFSSRLSRYGDRIPFYEWLFERCDWLTNEQAMSYFKSPINNEYAIQALEKCANDPLTLKLRDFEPENKYKFPNARYDDILDLIIYNGHLYVGSDEGLYHANAEWESNSVNLQPLEKRTEHEAVQMSARFGTINLSCGEDGLFSLIERYENSAVGVDKSKEFKKIEKKSFASNWCKFDLINYPEFATPQFFQTKTDKTQIRVEHDTTVIADIAPIGKSVWDIPYKNKPRKRAPIETEELAYTFNSNRTFFGATADGTVYRSPLVYCKEKQEPERRPIQSTGIRLGSERILSTHAVPILEGAVVEHFETVLFMHKKGVMELLREPVHVLRTFPQSHQYQNLVLAITDDGLWLMSVFDEEKIKNQNIVKTISASFGVEIQVVRGTGTIEQKTNPLQGIPFINDSDGETLLLHTDLPLKKIDFIKTAIDEKEIKQLKLIGTDSKTTEEDDIELDEGVICDDLFGPDPDESEEEYEVDDDDDELAPSGDKNKERK